MNRDRLNPTETVRVNMDEEILKMAKAAGLPTEKHLDLQVTMTQREYYRAVITAHYRGKEEGFNEGAGMRLAIVQRLRQIRNAVVYFSVAALALIGVCSLIVRFIR